jgi:hypothetical protein
MFLYGSLLTACDDSVTGAFQGGNRESILPEVGLNAD